MSRLRPGTPPQSLPRFGPAEAQPGTEPTTNQPTTHQPATPTQAPWLAAVASWHRRYGAVVETTLIVLGLLAILLLIPHDVYWDGEDRLGLLNRLLGQGILSGYKYSLIGPLFAAPLWYLGHIVSSPSRWIARYNWIVFAVGLGAMYWLLRKRVDRGLLRTFILLLIAASMFPNAQVNFYGEMFTAICVGVGTLAAVFGPALVGWVAVVLGVANTPATLVGLGLAMLQRIITMRRLRYAFVVVAAAGLIGFENWIRRGSPTNFGYRSLFSFPLLIGVLSIVLSFGKGLIFFTPGLFLPVKKSMLALRQGARQLYATWYAWYGGWWWGPRFFLFASLPASLVLAVRLRQRDGGLWANLLTLGVLALSVWVDINGAVYDQNTLFTYCNQPAYVNVLLCYYHPELSALWRPFFVAEPLNWKNILYIVYCGAVFLYLAAPLAWRIWQQATAWLRDLTGGLPGLLAWRL